MKFNDGFWLLKNGVKPYYGLQVVQTEPKEDGYNLQVATRPIRHRGDTLGGQYILSRALPFVHYVSLGPVLSVKVHSPTEGVIGVKIDHFKHQDPSPNISLFPDDKAVPNVTLSKNESAISLTTGDLTAEITEQPYTITFKSPSRTLTSAGYKHQAVFDIPSRWTLGTAANSSCLAMDPSSNPNPERLPDTVRYVHSELNLSPGELVYGLGEQFGAFVKNGKIFYSTACAIPNQA